MVYITGDCHANFRKFSSRRFKAQKQMTRDDFVIVCGDFGGIWKDDERERYWLNWLAQKPFTLLFVDGNHENFDRLYSNEFEVVDFRGGKAHKIADNIYHLMRGYVFELCGKTFFVFGGASSHDIDDGILDRADFVSQREFQKTYKNWYLAGKLFRVNHEAWWARELPSQEEMDRGRKNLKVYGNRVDFVISHCLPQTLAHIFFSAEADTLTTYFDDLVRNGLQMDSWYCGHYHVDQWLTDKFRVLYHDKIRII